MFCLQKHLIDSFLIFRKQGNGVEAFLPCLAYQAKSPHKQRYVFLPDLLQSRFDIVPVLDLQPVAPQTEQLCYPHEFEPLAGKAEMAHTHVAVLKRQEGLEKILGRVFDGKDGDGGGIPENVERMPACGQQLDLFRIEDVQGDLYVIVELRYRDAGPHVELMGRLLGILGQRLERSDDTKIRRLLTYMDDGLTKSGVHGDSFCERTASPACPSGRMDIAFQMFQK